MNGESAQEEPAPESVPAWRQIGMVTGAGFVLALLVFGVAPRSETMATALYYNETPEQAAERAAAQEAQEQDEVEHQAEARADAVEPDEEIHGTMTPDVTVEMTPEELHELAEQIGPIYWAGDREDEALYVTVTGPGNIWVQYFPDEEALRDGDYFAVVTWQEDDGLAALHQAAEEAPVAESEEVGDGLAVVYEENQHAVWYSYPEAHHQVEVYDPAEPGAALEALLEGEITRVGE